MVGLSVSVCDQPADWYMRSHCLDAIHAAAELAWGEFRFPACFRVTLG